MRGAAAILCLLASPSLAEGDALTWLKAGLKFPHHVNEVGTWTAPDGVIVAVDPLTLYGVDRPIDTLPVEPARVIGIQEEIETGRTAAILLMWSDSEVVCGKDIATIGVDTGLAAFMLPADAVALEVYAKPFDGELYAGPYGEQIDELTPGPFLVDLPDVSAFPLTGSGWGDGGYPVATLIDADGAIVALYAQFIAEGADWHLPPACAKPSS